MSHDADWPDREPPHRWRRWVAGGALVIASGLLLAHCQGDVNDTYDGQAPGAPDLYNDIGNKAITLLGQTPEHRLTISAPAPTTTPRN